MRTLCVLIFFKIITSKVNSVDCIVLFMWRVKTNKFARTGAKVEILAESTLRRVPEAAELSLTQAGICFRRIIHPAGLPMHNKFVLAKKGNRQWVMFGSFNWTVRSYWLNHEIGAISTNDQLFDAFAERWEVMKAQADGTTLNPTRRKRLRCAWTVNLTTWVVQ